MIQSNRRLTIREISEDLNISYGSINRSEHETSECKICSTCFDGRTKATAIVNFIGVVRSCRFRFKLFGKSHAASDSSFLGKAITGNETWIYGYDPETRVQSSQQKSPSSPRAKKRFNHDPTSR